MLLIILWVIAQTLFYSVISYRQRLSKLNFRVALEIAASLIIVTAFLAVFEYGIIALFLAFGLSFEVFNILRPLSQSSVSASDKSIKKTWKLLIPTNITLFLVTLLLTQNPDLQQNLLLVINLSALAVGIVVLGNSIKNLTSTKLLRFKPGITNEKTVSLLIPARNEDHALDESLRSALAIDYPKLEIIVLDDCSQDNTAEIIKSYAHDGVRFISGGSPPKGWLGKNYAMHQLAQEASGDILFFCDVDTVLTPQAVTLLLRHMKYNRLDMLSVMPGSAHVSFLAHLLRPLKNFWLLAFPLGLFGKVPASSNLFLIEKRTLNVLGGFESVKGEISPESNFAQHLARRHRYGLITSSSRFRIKLRKTATSQIESTIRNNYPLLGKDPAKLLLAILFDILFITLPLTQIFITPNYIGILSSLAFILSYTLVVARLSPKTAWLAPLQFHFLVVYEDILALRSMHLYEFREVKWKERNICYPVLQVIPKLPDPS